MSVKNDASGRRYVQVEVEVPGTPEEVWKAIATGPGVSSWFVPTEQREDGKVVSHFGPGMDVVATRTAWEPPHRFAAESEGFGPSAPPLATEWIVEARSGGICLVRVVHSLFASSDDWDNQLESVESGWPSFFRILRLYLTHFGGQTCSAFRVMGLVNGPASVVWDELLGRLGFAGVVGGQQSNTDPGAPRLTGQIEWTGEPPQGHQLILRVDDPAPGIAHFFAHGMGGQVFLTLSFYLYGTRAETAAENQEPLWNAWMTEQFAPLGATSKAC